MTTRFIVERCKYTIYAQLAKTTSVLFLFTDGESVISKGLYSIHKNCVFKAHTARLNAQEEM